MKSILDVAQEMDAKAYGMTKAQARAFAAGLFEEIKVFLCEKKEGVFINDFGRWVFGKTKSGTCYDFAAKEHRVFPARPKLVFRPSKSVADAVRNS